MNGVYFLCRHVVHTAPIAKVYHTPVVPAVSIVKTAPIVHGMRKNLIFIFRLIILTTLAVEMLIEKYTQFNYEILPFFKQLQLHMLITQSCIAPSLLMQLIQFMLVMPQSLSIIKAKHLGINSLESKKKCCKQI